MSLYANLNPGDSLLGSDEVSRYCSPNHYDRRRSEPRVSAFQRKPAERNSNPMKDPSFNRLQFFQLPDRACAINRVRQEFLSSGYKLSTNGGFAVFNVGEAKAAALQIGNYRLLFTYDPVPPFCSHSLMSNLPTDLREELVVATAIKRLVTKSGITFQALS